MAEAHARGVAASALSTLVLVVGLTSWAAAPLEAMLSMKQVAARIVTGDRPGEPVLASPMLVRGLTYYTDLPPRVVSLRRRPFFTPHPIPVVQGASGLVSFVREAGPTRCVLRDVEW